MFVVALYVAMFLLTIDKYFNVWAQTGCGKEVDRSFKRFVITSPGLCTKLTHLACSLKTQQAYVQNEERQLEEKRVHCELLVPILRSEANRLQTSKSWMHSRVRFSFSKTEAQLVTIFLAFADLFHPGERWTTTTVRIHSANSIQDANEQADAPESTAPKEQHHYASGSNVSAQLTSWATRLSTTADVEPHFRSSYHPARCTIM